MRIAIISDSHDNLPNLKKAFDWIRAEKIKMIIHCGDLSRRETLKYVFDWFGGKILLSRGNCDIGAFENVPNFRLYEDFGETKAGGKKIAFSHFPKAAEKLAREDCCDFVFYGHTHEPWVRKIGNTILANPGNLAGIFYKATFAVCDTKTGKLELKLLERL